MITSSVKTKTLRMYPHACISTEKGEEGYTTHGDLRGMGMDGGRMVTFLIYASFYFLQWTCNTFLIKNNIWFSKKNKWKDTNIMREKDWSILDNCACFMAPRRIEGTAGFFWKWPDGLLVVCPWSDLGPNQAWKTAWWGLPNSIRALGKGSQNKYSWLRAPVSRGHLEGCFS